MTTRTAAPLADAAPERRPTLPEAFEAIGAMEKSLDAAKDFVNALAMLAETLDEAEGLVVQRLAWTARDHLIASEDARGRVFHALHPHRFPDAQRAGQ